MRRIAYILLAIVLILAVMTLLKTNLLASDGRRMQEILSGLRQAEEEVGELEEEISKAKSLQTVAARAGEMGFEGAIVKRIRDYNDEIATAYPPVGGSASQ